MKDNENYKFLLEIGFTLNEAKVYLTLLQNRYLNGYEISKLSNVSRSLVYNVIDRLVAKGFILKSEGQINYYCALPYDKVIEKIRNDNTNKLNVAREKFKNYSRIENESEYIFNIKGIDEFFSKANDLILNAEKEISISIWKEDVPKIEESLSIASKKGIKIYISVCFVPACMTTQKLSSRSNLAQTRSASFAASQTPYSLSSCSTPSIILGR